MNTIKADAKRRTKARKVAKRHTDFDTWADRLIVFSLIALPLYLIGRTLIG